MTALRQWLTLDTSLTARLQSLCGSFRVQRLRQRTGLCLADESPAVGLPRRMKVRERDVLLCCDGVPVVFAHTVVPLTATAADWPVFRKLGERSLGASLFGDPLVARHALQFAQLPPSHPLVRRILAALPPEQLESRLHQTAEKRAVWFARRSLFTRSRGQMLVTEVFLPGIAKLN